MTKPKLDPRITTDPFEAFMWARFVGKQLFTEEEMLEIFKQRVRLAGGGYKFAEEVNLSPKWVYNVMQGSAHISAGVLNPIGFRKIMFYERLTVVK